MKYLIAFCLFVCSLSVLSSCRKGDDDPFLSLRTRKARFTGEWNLSYSRVFHSSSSNNTTDESIFENGTETTIFTQNDSTLSTSVKTFTVSYTFEKDGTFEYVYQDQYINQVRSGFWTFLKRNKSNDLKNKEAVQLATTRIEENGYVIQYENHYPLTYDIVQLKNKEIVLEYNRKVDAYSDPQTTYETEESMKLVLKKK